MTPLQEILAMRRLAFAAGAAALLFAAPALAQTAEPADAPIPQDGGTVQTGPGTPIEQGLTDGSVPGVGLDGTAQTDTGATAGPGGLQNDVGAEGTMVPDSTGSSGTLGQAPGAPIAPDDAAGIPLGPDG